MASSFRSAGRAVAIAAAMLAPTTALAGDPLCRVVDLDFVPANLATTIRTPLQIVAWLEDPGGAFIDTVYMTQQTGSYGLGNRPGRSDFNSGPMWPYGRRVMVFPVWAHRHHYDFLELGFQDEEDDNLSHSVSDSSREMHYCLPLRDDESNWGLADAGTCASVVYTDKGKFSTRKSLYPPRADLARDVTKDSPEVDTFGMINPFDAISQATPRLDEPASVSWSIPPTLPPGNYVLWVETAREFDHNAAYSPSLYPSPTGIPFNQWGKAFRGQPSVVYKVPFTLAATNTTATTVDYVGYGDPTGADGELRPPDGTITTAVRGSGAQRLALTTDGYRVRVVARAEPDLAPPSRPTRPEVTEVTSRSATVQFVAPGDDGLVGRVKRYEVRIAVGADITEDTFAAAMLVDSGLVPADPGSLQTFEIEDLLFETEYAVAIRAFDDCANPGPIATLRFKTTERKAGEVDACFIATAAYGSALAADVGTLRQFRDIFLRKSVLGELAIEAYYTFGPAVSGVVGESDVLRATARAALEPIVALVRGFRL